MTTLALEPGRKYARDLIKDERHRSARAADDVADWLGWHKVENKAARTLDAYEKTLAVLLREYPNTAVDEFTGGDITHILSKFPPQSRSTHYSRIKGFFAWADLTERIEKNPMRTAPKVKPARRRIKQIFTDAEVTMLGELPDPDGPLMALLFGTGVRLAEASALQRKHVVIDIDEPRLSRLVVLNGKGGKDREIPMRSLVGPLWRLCADLNPADYLWYTRPAGQQIRRTRPVTQGSFYIWWRRCLETAGVTAGKRTVHSTRHTYATRWIRRGGPVDILADNLGHSSVATTYDEYVHTSPEDVWAALELVEG